MNHDDLIAWAFANERHAGQVRKYTGNPYIEHCEEVALIVSRAGGTPQMIQAALLHDVVEDTDTELSEIFERFGHDVGLMVAWLTEMYTSADFSSHNRASRKRMEAIRFSNAPPQVQTIKYADLISNTKSIVEYDPNFARVYLAEKQFLLSVANQGDQALYNEAMRLATSQRKEPV